VAKAVRVALFVEDFAHEKVIGTLVKRVAEELGFTPQLDWRNATRGHGAVVGELKRYVQDLNAQGSPFPDLIIVATDANCHGLKKRKKELTQLNTPLAPMIFAIPDPHVERWLLLDGAAFRKAVGVGCDAPGRKCDRKRYKKQLVDAILAAGITPSLGGIEFAEDIVQAMDLDNVAQNDRSFKDFITALRGQIKQLSARPIADASP